MSSLDCLSEHRNHTRSPFHDRFDDRWEPSPAQPSRIGTRRSPLALAQAQEVRQRLQQAHDLPPEAFKIMPMHAVRHGRCCGCC
ncbi:MAG: hypothetical protein GDA40_03965 [Rhodobacteraceae bacterium]|nr:hypothetical protein [Paracoccaceae bacterium]